MIEQTVCMAAPTGREVADRGGDDEAEDHLRHPIQDDAVAEDGGMGDQEHDGADVGEAAFKRLQEIAALDENADEDGVDDGEGETFRTLTIQQSGGARRAVEAGVEAVREMLPVAERARRETCPASELTLALQCGGSDGYSGVTANPALGVAADLLVRQGGTAILSETPEIYGAEHLLTRRADSREVGEKLLEIIRWWEDYAVRMGGDLNNNPSPGNKAGGLTTILEKSLGAAMKGEEIFREILAVSSGRRTRSECLGYGDAEFVPWQLGATM